MGLTKDSVIPISFIVPRKSGGDVFQEDIFPNCLSAKPAQSADEWSAGGNVDPNTMSMDPDDRKDEDIGGNDVEFTKRATYGEVEAEKKKKETMTQKMEIKGNALYLESNDLVLFFC